MFQRKWYRNFLMKGFHVVVILAAGPGIRDTQVIGVLHRQIKKKLYSTCAHGFGNIYIFIYIRRN